MHRYDYRRYDYRHRISIATVLLMVQRSNVGEVSILVCIAITIPSPPVVHYIYSFNAGPRWKS